MKFDLNKIKSKIRRPELYCLIFFAFVVRLFGLGEKSLWHDEILHFNVSSLPLIKIVQALLMDVHPPLGFISFWPVAILTREPFWLRLPAALFGTAAVGFCFLFVRQISDRSTAFLTSAMLAILAGHVYLSQSLRMYALFSLLSLATLYFHSLTTKNGGRRRWLILYSVSAILTIYTHNYALFLIAGLAVIDLLSCVIARKNFLKYLKLYSIISVAYAPWLVILISQYERATQLNYNWLLKAGSGFFTTIINYYLYGHASYVNSAGSKFFLLVYLATIIVSITIMVKNKKYKLVGYVGCGLVILAAIFIISIFKPVAFPRHLVFSVPLFLLPIAFLPPQIAKFLGRLKSRGKYIGYFGLAIVVVLLIAGEGAGLSYHFNRGYHQADYKGDWKQARVFHEKYGSDQIPVIALSKGKWTEVMLGFYLPEITDSLQVHADPEDVIKSIKARGESVVFLNNTSKANQVIEYIENNYQFYHSGHFLGGHAYRIYRDVNDDGLEGDSLKEIALNLDEVGIIDSSQYFRHSGAMPLTNINGGKKCELMRGSSTLAYLVLNYNARHYKLDIRLCTATDIAELSEGELIISIGQNQIDKCEIAKGKTICSVGGYLKKTLGYLNLRFSPKNPYGALYIENIAIDRQ